MKIENIAEGKVSTKLMHICLFTSAKWCNARTKKDYEDLGAFGAVLNDGNDESHNIAMAIYEKKANDPAYKEAQRRRKEGCKRGGKIGGKVGAWGGAGNSNFVLSTFTYSNFVLSTFTSTLCFQLCAPSLYI